MRGSSFLTIICCLSASALCWSQQQTYEKARYRPQAYYGDSAHVFWTAYPNPFYPSVDKEGRVKSCGDLSFYCDLSDSVVVALLAENDSVVYQSTVRTSTPPGFSLCYWVADEKTSPVALPEHFFKAERDERVRWLLIAGGKWKCARQWGNRLSKGKYYWLDEGH